jgi:tight adherence protein C
VTTIVVVAAAAAVLWKNQWTLIAAGLALASFANLLLGVAAAVAVTVWWVGRRRRDPVEHSGDDALLADLTVLGLSAGLTFPAAAEAAAGAVDGDASARLLRALRLRNAVDANAAADPALMVVARRALSTGAPLIPAVSAFAARLRDEERSRQLSAARRLPVKLLFPLALLILPGFLVLTIGPAVLGSLERLGL